VRHRSLVCKFSLFTGLLVFSLVLAIISLETRLDLTGLWKGLVLGCILVLIGVALSRMAIR
jgi:hypothetical protein